MTQSCPSDLALEQHVAGLADSLSSHVEGCANCQSRLMQMKAEGDRFNAVGFPRTIDRVLAATTGTPKPAWFRRPWMLGVPALAAVAVILVAREPSLDASYVGTKGDDFSFDVYVNRPTGAEPIVADGRVPANAQLRFSVHPAAPCWVTIISVDATGAVSRLYPAREIAARVEHAGSLPGGAEMDGVAGPERIFAVCAPTALSMAELEQAAHKSIGSGPEAVRNTTTLGGLPEGAKQATVLLQKQP